MWCPASLKHTPHDQLRNPAPTAKFFHQRLRGLKRLGQSSTTVDGLQFGSHSPSLKRFACVWLNSWGLLTIICVYDTQWSEHYGWGSSEFSSHTPPQEVTPRPLNTMCGYQEIGFESSFLLVFPTPQISHSIVPPLFEGFFPFLRLHLFPTKLSTSSRGKSRGVPRVAHTRENYEIKRQWPSSGAWSCQLLSFSVVGGFLTQHSGREQSSIH